MDGKYIKAFINFTKEFDCGNFPVAVVVDVITKTARMSGKSIEQYLDMYLQ